MERNLKRKRTQPPFSTSKEVETVEPYERSQDFYFDDGNVVLVAEKTAFRVHRGVLARHSPVFRDMFRTVQQPNDAESFDGCSGVKLSDKSIDMKRLLSVLYDVTPLVSQEADILFAVLRMGHKYLMDNLHQYSCDALRLAYPSSLAQWDRYTGERPNTRYLISLARQTGAEILLPSAFYHMVCTKSSAEAIDLKPTMTTFELSTLHRGKERVLSIWADFLRVEMDTDDCEQQDCADDWKERIELLLQETLKPGYFQTPDPLRYLQQFSDFADEGWLCEDCREHVKIVTSERRLKIWDELPGIFGFPCWDDLAKM